MAALELYVDGFGVHWILSIALVVYVVWAFVSESVRKRSKPFDEWLNRIGGSLEISDRAKWWFMAVMAVFSIFLYMYCWWCKAETSSGEGEASYLDYVYKDLLGIAPWFVWGCILAGFVIKYMTLGKLRLPKSMLGAGLFASVIPICSCAGVPLAHGMMLGKQMRVRAVITFLVVVPILSPMVMVLAVARIGWEYLVIEIISVFVIAMSAGVLIERFAGVKEPGDARAGCYSCEGCRSSKSYQTRTSALLAGWDQLMYLMKFIFLGILLGSIIATYLNEEMIVSFIGDRADVIGSIPGLVLLVLIAIPIFICSGEDVIILAPLLAFGLPLGHAIAFAICGNAICISAIPVLNATFGKKVTVLIVATFFVGGILIGLAINALVWLFT
ncbi:MAG: permease [Methanobacteriota archaeon]